MAGNNSPYATCRARQLSTLQSLRDCWSCSERAAGSMMPVLHVCCVLVALALASPGASASKLPPTADTFLIESLPTLGGSFSPDFKQYSGFMPLGDAAGTHLFFWFVESQRDPATDPVRLLNIRRPS